MSHPPPALPAPRWTWLPFALVPALVCGLAASIQDGTSAGMILRETGAGLAAGGLLVAGLALAERFFVGRGARLAGGVVFAALLAVSSAAVGFAGCIPYPYIHKVTPRAAATAPMLARTGRPQTNLVPVQPQPTPVTVVEWRTWPSFFSYADDQDYQPLPPASSASSTPMHRQARSTRD